jgi:predicted enzyme related to lactoylglutathione lyase
MAPEPVVHLELHTGDLPRATSFYYELFGWRPEHVRTAGGSYLALQMGNGLGGGVVECGTDRPIWLPYVEVPEIRAATDRALESGASVVLEPREGPAGFRSVVSAPASGEIALWQQKR